MKKVLKLSSLLLISEGYAKKINKAAEKEDYIT